jgi:hypothetical protein
MDVKNNTAAKMNELENKNKTLKITDVKDMAEMIKDA